MGWQILHISQPAQLTLEHKQCSLFLVEKHEKVILPFDNLSAVIIESHAVTITSALLQAFSANQIAVFVCNETHLPNGILLPFMPYFAYSKVARTCKPHGQSLLRSKSGNALCKPKLQIRPMC